MARASLREWTSRFQLGLVDDLATLPGNGFNQLSDFPLDAIAEMVGVHGVEFPAVPPMVGDEPLVTRVLPLIGRRERRQSLQLFKQSASG